MRSMHNTYSKLKKILSGILALSVVLACACGKSDKSETQRKSRAKKTEEVISDASEKETEKESETDSGSDKEEPAATETSPSSFDADQAKSYMSSVDFDGVVLVAEGDQIVWTYASGYADRKNKTPNTMDTVFEFGSITKQFTAVAIMQLEEQGLLSTDDKLDKYIPEYKYADQITIHQLLNMTSGISDYLFNGMLGFSFDDFDNMTVEMLLDFENTMTKLVTTPLSKDEFVTKISEYPLDFTPGTQNEYSNSNYYLLGIIIEKLSGMSYDEYVRKNILEPLGLKDLYPDIDHLTSNGRTDLFIKSFDLPHQDATAPATVWFTSDISPESLVKIYQAMNVELPGKTGIKLSTGESERSNYLRPALIGDLVQMLNGTIVECNTAYGGSRASTAMHRQQARDNGLTEVADLDILDEEGSM